MVTNCKVEMKSKEQEPLSRVCPLGYEFRELYELRAKAKIKFDLISSNKKTNRNLCESDKFVDYH